MVACSGSTNTRLDCDETGKCDTPGGTVKEQCTNSRVNAMDEKRPHFTNDGVRWSCKDVNGVTPNSNTSDDRGQEYCEYFTMLHTNGIPEVVLDGSGSPTFCDDTTPCATGTCNTEIFSCVTASTVNTAEPADVLGKNTNGETITPLDPVLKKGQLEWLAQNPTSKVGECVFTSWHKDIDRPIASAEKLGGYDLNATTPGAANKLFRMEVQFNSNGAAKQLVEDCLAPGKAEEKDGFMRGCEMCGDKSCVPWRKSDPSVCTMAMRIAECGCSVSVGGRKLDISKSADLETVRDLFVPESRRGFTLGTWDNMAALPTGCRVVKTGDSERLEGNGWAVTDANADRTIVACDLNGSHITSATAKDPKEACRLAYGDEVVVHVRAPLAEAATLSCTSTEESCKGAPWEFSKLLP
ncbi:MAG: hypothetical protein H0V17_01685 [Deltaproteobacteria bacterium]|nr:hypothetical protein [Deltaproteobacteria bacterium]